MGLPAALGDVGVVVGAPVAVAVGARTDGLAVRETVLSFILVMTRRSPMVPPGVPSAGVEGVTEGIDFHVRTVLGRHQTGSRARGILVKVARFHEHDNVLFRGTSLCVSTEQGRS